MCPLQISKTSKDKKEKKLSLAVVTMWILFNFLEQEKLQPTIMGLTIHLL